MTTVPDHVPTAPQGHLPVCVCVPARNEAERLPRLLAALAEHTLEARLPVVILINNSTDASETVALLAKARHGDRLDLDIHTRTFAPALAHAGSARRWVMDLGAKRVGPDGVLLATDADARPPHDWVAANLAAIAGGVDMVGGRLELEDDHPVPAGVLRLRSQWRAYWASVREIEDEIDPQAWDPPPRHGDHTGGSLAITVDLYGIVGGAPLRATGEDRALVAAGQAAGGRLAHPEAVWTRVSTRRDGRAEAGMALDMALLHAAAASASPMLAPRLSHWRDRAHWRARVRKARGVREMLALEAALPPMPMDQPIGEIVPWV